MQSSDIVLYNLSKQATKEDYQYDRLYRNLYNEDFYVKAYSKIYKNKGSATKGIDEETADGFGEEKIQAIIESLKDESYQPKPVRRINIPKKNGSTRPLGIPTFTDRIVQEVCRMILEAIYEPTFTVHSHGFREKRSCHTALIEIKNTFTGVNWFIEGDIKGFFDNINHQVLINVLRKRIKDEKFIRLMWKFLKAGFVDNWRFQNTYSGTPQGGIISPTLANIYLNELDRFIEKELKPTFDKGEPKKGRKRNTEYRKYDMRNQRLKKKIDATMDEELRKAMIEEYKENKKILLNLPYYEPNTDSYKSLKYVRYADDFLIGVNGSKADCEQIKNAIGNFLNENLQLKMSEEKTLITHSTSPAKFLGYDITISNDLSTAKDKNGVIKRKYRGYVQLRIPKGTIERIIVDRKMVKDIDAKQWDMLHRPRLVGLSDLEIIETYNAELRGLYNYYSLAENVSKKMWQLRYVMEYSCLKTLANKYKSSVSKMKTKYRQGKYWGVKYETKQGEKIAYFYKDGFEKKKESYKFDIDQKPNLYVYQGRNDLEKRLNAKQCELCGDNHPDTKFEIHHINKIKNLKGKEYWEWTMIAKQRKTLVVCQKCHIEIHKQR
ncbi:group II intron reverse transcriptase/maturase [Bacillus sp. NPDC094106]|uniref:group II intron reverse transcriptase/maturase n=1 Tax=Bacillus sp. NPDC094106 TaxID=3363949 RepID=UPI00382DFC17